jgi:DNA-directed RNA polymerase specialized sigma24 family protein
VRWSELATRQLLRKMHTPAAIDDDPIALALVRATNARSPRDAVRAAVDAALRPYPQIYATIVRRMDVEGEDVGTVVAELGCSARSVYRYRARAMTAIRYEIEALTREPRALRDSAA